MSENFHLGCCLACRAPFLPSTEFFYEEACQAVFYLQNRFPIVSRHIKKSEFTGPPVGAHVITRAHYAHAVRFCAELPFDDILKVGQTTCKGAGSKSSRGGGAGAAQAAAQKQAVVEAVKGAVNAGQGAGQTVDQIADAAARSAATAAQEAAQASDTYSGRWDKPLSLPHVQLKEWLKDSFQPVDLNLELTLLNCSPCNQVYDCFARMGRVLRDFTMVPENAITAKGGRTTSAYSMPSANPDLSKIRSFLGLLVSYYLHRSLVYLKEELTATPTRLSTNRTAVALLLYLPLHLVCLHLELKLGRAQDQNAGRKDSSSEGKGAHTYLGLMDFVIARYLHTCAMAEFGRAPDVSRFAVLYMRELVEAPAPLWDARHAYLRDYVFEGAPDTMNGLVSHASDRLMTLYKERARPLVLFCNQDPTLDAALLEPIRHYFITPEETAEVLLRDFEARAEPNNISYFIEHVGVVCTLWQLRRYLMSETPRLGTLLDEWIHAFLVREWTNIMDNCRFGIDMLQAQQLYAMQNARDVRRLLGPAGQLGSGLEISLLRTLDTDSAEDLIAEAGRCSVFKAAVRLRQWSFTRPAPYAGLDARWADAACQPSRASLSTWASLSARLIVDRSDSTARIVASSRRCHGASARADSRRGCSGSGNALWFAGPAAGCWPLPRLAWPPPLPRLVGPPPLPRLGGPPPLPRLAGPPPLPRPW